MGVRVGNIDDIDVIFALNEQLFAESWSKQSFLNVMQSGFDLYVCETDGQFKGYILSQDILDEVHIMQVAVAPDHQRRGVAKQLSKRLLADKYSYHIAMLEVRASNKAAQALYRQLGFKEVGCRKSYYRPKNKQALREDAVLMQLDFPKP